MGLFLFMVDVNAARLETLRRRSAARRSEARRFNRPGRNSSRSSSVPCPAGETESVEAFLSVRTVKSDIKTHRTFMELSLLILGLKLFGSLLNVISSSDRKRFIPASRL